MDGMNSMRAWDIDIEIKNTHKISGDKKVKRKTDELKTNAPTVLTWIPGITPVTAPHKTPIMHIMMISIKLSPSGYIMKM